MQTPTISRAQQLRFLEALTKGGNVASAAMTARVDEMRLDEARRTDPTFAREWEEAENARARRLEHEAWRRAVDGVPEPLISDGKIVRDDDGRPLSIQRYSDALLIEILRMNRPNKFIGRSFWMALRRSRPMRRLALISVITLSVLVVGGLALQWLRNHVFVATFH